MRNKRAHILPLLTSTLFYGLPFSYALLSPLWMEASYLKLLQDHAAFLVPALFNLVGRLLAVYVLTILMNAATLYCLELLFPWRLRKFARIAFHLGCTLFIFALFSLRFMVYRPAWAEDYFKRGALLADRKLLLWVTDHLDLKIIHGFEVALILLPPLLVLLLLAFPRLWKKHGRLFTPLVLLLVGLFSSRTPHSSTPFYETAITGERSRPNVLILAVDSLRPDKLSFTGERGDRLQVSPHIDRFLSGSIFFRNSITALARTAPSWTSILTGTYPPIHGIRHMFPSQEERGVLLPSLVSILRDNGYSTSVISDYAGEMFDLLDFHFERKDVPGGFAITSMVSREILYQHFPAVVAFNGLPARLLLPELRFLPVNADPFLLADKTIKEMRELEARERPYLILSFFSSVHLPYTLLYPYYKKYADPLYRGENKYAYALRETSQLKDLGNVSMPGEEAEQIRRLYDQALNETDEAIGHILDFLARREKGPSSAGTIVVLLSDHGEILMEDGRSPQHGSTMGFHDEDLKMLFALNLPAKLHAKGARPQRVDSLVRSIDILPTLLGILGIPAPPTGQGMDLLGDVSSQGTLIIPKLIAYAETDVALNAAKEFIPYDAFLYPGVQDILEIEGTSPGHFVLKDRYRLPFYRAKWRMVVQGQGEGERRLIYIPDHSGEKGIFYVPDPAGKKLRGLSPSEETGLRDLRDEFWNIVLSEPGTAKGSANTVEYY